LRIRLRNGSGRREGTGAEMAVAAVAAKAMLEALTIALGMTMGSYLGGGQLKIELDETAI
jgi:hypothetical protein